MVLFAVPPEETHMLPRSLTVVSFAIPPLSTVMESFLRMMPSLDSPLEMMYAIWAAFQFTMIRFCVSSITIMLFQEEIKPDFSFFHVFLVARG